MQKYILYEQVVDILNEDSLLIFMNGTSQEINTYIKNQYMSDEDFEKSNFSIKDSEKGMPVQFFTYTQPSGRVYKAYLKN